MWHTQILNRMCTFWNETGEILPFLLLLDCFCDAEKADRTRAEATAHPQDNHQNSTSIFPKTSCVAAAPPGMKPRETLQRFFSFREFQMKFTTRRAVCSSSAPCKYEKICVNFHGLVQEQWCVVCFETCAVIWKIYLAELLLPSYSFSGFSGSFTEMRRKDIRLKKRSFICQSTVRMARRQLHQPVSQQAL